MSKPLYPFETSLLGGVDACREIAGFHRTLLIEEIAPFWLKHGVDKQHGGYLTCLNRDGSLMSGDKSVWFLGRMAWMFSRMALTYGAREEWVEAASSGIGFMEQHAFDCDGRMFYSLTREGRPLRKRRYLFSECFAIIALAAYSELTNSPDHLQRAESILQLVLHYQNTPGLLEPKVNPETRPGSGLSLPMILLVTAQELRRSGGDATVCNRVIDDSIREIRKFVNADLSCVLEMTGPNGEFIDTLEGRCLNPGHALEAGWFILEEARQRKNDPALKALGLQIIDWSLKIGWDDEHGGIYYFRDARTLPCTEYWHDMKFWWPHNEALLAALYAWDATGLPVYAEWYDRIAQWSFRHFPDPEFGEWYGYLHRPGTVSTPVKGTLFKGFFHLPRMLMQAEQLISARI